MPCVHIVIIYVCMPLVLIFVEETAIIQTQDLLTLQGAYIQLNFCEIYGETAHSGKKRCITTQTLIRPTPREYRCLVLCSRALV